MPVGHNDLSFYSLGFGMHLCPQNNWKEDEWESMAQRAIGPLDPTLGLVNRGLVCTFVPSATSHPLRLPKGAHLLNFHHKSAEKSALLLLS